MKRFAKLKNLLPISLGVLGASIAITSVSALNLPWLGVVLFSVLVGKKVEKEVRDSCTIYLHLGFRFPAHPHEERLLSPPFPQRPTPFSAVLI